MSPRMGVGLNISDGSDGALDIELSSGGAGHFPTLQTDGKFGIDLDELAALSEWCIRVCKALDSVTGEAQDDL